MIFLMPLCFIHGFVEEEGVALGLEFCPQNQYWTPVVSLHLGVPRTAPLEYVLLPGIFMIPINHDRLIHIC